MAPRLQVGEVRKAFAATQALDGVSLDVLPGEVHALIGENGAGKSTLMKILSGAEQPDQGVLVLDGQPFRPRDPLDARRRGVAMVYQELSLAPHLSVMDNALLGVEPVKFGLLDRRAARRMVNEALERVSGHRAGRICPDTRAGDLPVADQQLVEIARALLQGDCRLLILDEPTSTLAGDDVAHLFTLIRSLRDRGTSVIYISHFLEEVRQIADRYTVLRDGRSVGGGVMADATIPQLVGMMAGRQISELFPRTTRTPGDVLLEVTGLAGASRPADATLSLRRGEVLGIAGLIGAGRTELLRAIFGLDAVRRGEVRISHVAGGGTPARRISQGAGLVSEDRKGEGLAVRLTLADNVTLSRLPAGPLGLVRPSAMNRQTQSWIDRLRVRCRSPRQRVLDLSGGNQQKLAIARLLHQQADLFLLDEPTRGIDVGSKTEIYSLINELAAEGRAVLMVSSYLPELLGVCDRIAVMCRGRLGTARPVAEWTEHTLLVEAIGAGAAQ